MAKGTLVGKPSNSNCQKRNFPDHPAKMAENAFFLAILLCTTTTTTIKQKLPAPAWARERQDLPSLPPNYFKLVKGF
jgi:hypothetical protein